MTDTTQTPGPIQPLTSFPGYGGFFPSFPFGGLNQQFGASMQPFGGGYGGWGMPQQSGSGGWPSLFGGGMMPQMYGGGMPQMPGGGMGGYGGMGGMPYGGGTGGGLGSLLSGAGFPFGMGQQGQGAQQPQAGISDGFGLAPTGGTFNPQQTSIAPGSAGENSYMRAMLPGGAGFQQLQRMEGIGTGAAQMPQPSAPSMPQAPSQPAPQPPSPMQPPSWNAGQLAQANGTSPGLADYMLAHNAGADSNPANQQFYQAAGFTNPAGSQSMLNQAGRQWIMNNNQTYGNINADAGQPNGPRMGYGMMGNTPYSYSLAQAANNPALQQWLMRARSGLTPSGPAPAGVNVYSQFGGG